MNFKLKILLVTILFLIFPEIKSISANVIPPDNNNKPLALTLDGIVTTDILTCYGAAEGSITISASNGQEPYLYSIDGGLTYQSSNVFSNLVAAGYTVVVKDDYNVMVSDFAVILDRPQIFINSETYTDVTGCYDDSNGEINISASGGTDIFEYSIDGGISYFANGGNFPSLSGGVYNVYVRDSYGCVKQGSEITVSQPDELVIIDEVYTNIAPCYGNNNGTIDITASGGTSSITYSIDNGLTYNVGKYFSGLSPGSYNVKIKDVNNCITTGSLITLTEPVQMLINSEVVNDVNTCFNENSGSISINASGGTGDIQYSIDGGNFFQISNTFNNLYAGTYDVVVKDQNLCTIIGSTLTINEPPELIIDSVSKADVIQCFGDSTGNIIIYASGGTPGFLYSVDFGTTYQSSNSFNNLPYGSYSVKVKDLNGCELTGNTYNIYQPEQLSIFKVDKADVNTCYGGNNGSITVSAIGGTPALEYSVDAGATYIYSNIITDLIEGFYTVVVRDSHLCSDTFSTQIYISQPSQIIISSEITSDPACYGGTDGQINILASGGTGTLQYSANGGLNYYVTNVLTGLSAGITYQTMVQDVNGCIATGSSFVLNEPLELLIDSISNKSVSSCSGGDNGEILIYAQGGTSPLYYSINGGVDYSLSGNYTGLTAGSYSIMVKDAHSCIISGETIELTQPDVLEITNQLYTNILDCKGSLTGTITINALGGTEPLQYSVDGGTTYFSNSGYFTGLPAGTYPVVVRDTNLCLAYGSTMVITEPEELIPTVLSSTNLNCNASNDGTITMNASGGQSPYSFSIDGGVTFAFTTYFAGLTPGNYQTYVKDAYGCIKMSDLVTITEPTALVIQDVTYNNITDCYGDKDGTISITASGGTPDILYSIDNGSSYESTSDFYSLDEGTYYVRVIDNNECMATWTTSIEITQPAPLKITSISKTDITCYGLSDGTITFTGTGGTGNIQYSIDTGLTFVDNGGLFTGLSTGVYNLRLTDDNNCIVGDNVVTIYEPTQLVITSVNVTDESCINFGDGSITIFANAGTPNYEYSIDGVNYQSYLTFSGLTPGDYIPYLQDARNCIVTAPSVHVGSPESSAIFDVDIDQGCSPLEVQFNRLTSGITYLWDFGDGTTSLTNEPSHIFTNYTLSSVDYLVTSYGKSYTGCYDTAYYTITVYPQPAIDFTLNPDIVYFPDATANIINNSPPGYVNYLWDFDDGTTATAENPGSHAYDTCGVYTIKMSADNNWCSDTIYKDFYINAHQPLAGFDIDNINGCTPITINITDTSYYANSYMWDFGDGTFSTETSPSHYFANPGEYNVSLMIKGYCGTYDMDDTIVSVWASPIVEFEVLPDTVMAEKQPIHCYNYSETNSTYLWDFGDGGFSEEDNPIHFYQAPGDYAVTLYVTSENKCVDSLTLSAIVHVLPYGKVEFPNAFTPNNDGDNDTFGPAIYESVKEYELRIFNRGAELVFHTKDITEFWDGTYLGIPVVQDVYVWKASGKYENDEPFIFVGNVTLLK